MSAGVSDTSGCRVTPAAIGCRRRAEIFTRHRCHGRRVRCPRSREEPRGSLAPETAAASRASGRLPAGGATRSPETPECAEQGLRAEVRQQLWGQAGRGSPSFPRTHIPALDCTPENVCSLESLGAFHSREPQARRAKPQSLLIDTLIRILSIISKG